MDKQLDTTITTLKNFRHATKELQGKVQIYAQLDIINGDSSALIELTEVQLILAKNENEEPYLVLRCH